jgi:hypothetical protein
MNFQRLAAVMILGFGLSSSPLVAQTKRDNANRKSRQAPRAAAQPKLSPRTVQQRQRETALAALREAGDAASSITDRFQQSHTLATIAELLWKHDEPTARSLFARAWTVATAADRESADAAQSDASIAAADASITSSEAREEVLISAARCDDELAQRFLRESEKEIGDAESSSSASTSNTVLTSPSRRSPWGEMSHAALNRLALARTLLEEGTTRTIPALLAPVFREGVSGATIEFLIHLRRRDADLADKLYQTMLLAAPDALADANSVLIAGAYLISPRQLTVVDAGGGLQSRHIQAPLAARATSVADDPFASAARRAFGDFAVRVLSGARIDNSSAGERLALLFALERTLPFLTGENPAAAPGLRARRDALAATIDAARRDQLAQAAETDSSRAAKPDDALRGVRGQIRSLPEGAGRDAARFKLVTTAARHRRWADARLAAADITDLILRGRADTIIRQAQIARLAASYADDTADDYRRASRFVEESDVPPMWKAWGYAQAAQLAARRREPEQARTLLDAATSNARLIADDTESQVAALLIVAIAAHEVDRQRTPELLAEIVRAVNATENFDGEFDVVNEVDGAANDADGDAWIAAADSKLATFTLEELFGRIARENFTLALAEARNIERTLPRTLAVIGIARTMLKSSRSTPRASSPSLPRYADR